MQFTWIILKLSLPYTLLVHGNIAFHEISPWCQKYGGPLLYRKAALPLQDSGRSGANLSSLASAPCVGRKQASCFRSPPLWACRCCVMVRFGTEFLAAALGGWSKWCQGAIDLGACGSAVVAWFLHLGLPIFASWYQHIAVWLKPDLPLTLNFGVLLSEPGASCLLLLISYFPVNLGSFQQI